MEEYFSSVPIPIPMGKTIKIIRRSIHTFLQHYHYFTTTATLLALPFSASILISQSLSISSSLSLLPTIRNRLHSLFYAAGFPQSSEFFSILTLKLSQTITSSILVLPFTLSFLLLAKAFIIQKLNTQKPSSFQFHSFASLFNSLLRTQLCNSFVILSANATCFWLMFIAFNCLENLNLSTSTTSTLFFSAIGAVFYSIILANSLIICNLALVLSGMERSGGIISILKACVLIRGRTSTALSLALPINITLAAIEALFQFRVARAYSDSGVTVPTPVMVLEGLLIAYLYSILITLDTITGCFLFKSCKIAASVVDQESRYAYRLEIKSEGEEENDGSTFANVKISVEELP